MRSTIAFDLPMLTVSRINAGAFISSAPAVCHAISAIAAVLGAWENYQNFTQSSPFMNIFVVIGRNVDFSTPIRLRLDQQYDLVIWR